MPGTIDKWLISHYFDLIHCSMNCLRRYLLRIGDKEPLEQFSDMETALFSRMRDMRLLLGIAYDPDQPTDTEPLEKELQ